LALERCQLVDCHSVPPPIRAPVCFAGNRDRHPIYLSIGRPPSTSCRYLRPYFRIGRRVGRIAVGERPVESQQWISAWSSASASRSLSSWSC
jgi:hypothetical protein